MDHETEECSCKADSISECSCKADSGSKSSCNTTIINAWDDKYSWWHYVIVIAIIIIVMFLIISLIIWAENKEYPNKKSTLIRKV